MNRWVAMAVAPGMPTATANPYRRDRPYRAGVVTSARPAALRWVLLAVLAFGVVGMHCLSATGSAHAVMESAAMTSAPADAIAVESGTQAWPACCDDEHSTGHNHGLQHLCLAVLAAAFVLLIGRLLWRSDHAGLASRKPTPPLIRAGRSPPPRTGDLLTSLCVLRQ